MAGSFAQKSLQVRLHLRLLDVITMFIRTAVVWRLRLRQNDCFLPAENDSSLPKGPSWRLSAEVIYRTTTGKRLEVLQVGKNLL